MTRKSPPIANWPKNKFGACVLSCLALCSGGCSVFSRGFWPGGSSLTDYEQTRRSIENPVDIEGSEYADQEYQPEGVSAERQKDSMDLLRRIGLRSPLRKDIEVAREEFAAAEKLLEQAKTLEGNARKDAFRQAAELYQQAGENWRSSGLEQDALLMAAECRFFAEDYAQAETTYAQLIKEYPRNPYLDHVDSRRFEIADYWLKVDGVAHKPFLFVNFTDNKFPLNDTGGHGKRVLESVRLDNPTGKVSDDATMRLAVEQFSKGDYEGAADTFADLRLTYPDSEHQFKAQMLELQSLLASYQGVHYSSVPLTDAEKRVKQIVRQFPVEAESNQQEINQAFAKIRYLRAEREWHNAEYRRTKQENGSARFYYQRVLDEFSDTPFAEQARDRLTELQDQPDDPPEYFSPLIKLLGADDDKRPYVIDDSNR